MSRREAWLLNRAGAALVRACLTALCLLLSACSVATGRSAPPPIGTPSAREIPPIVVASFDFDESRLLAEIYTAALRDQGFAVRRLPDVASREIMEPALEQGLIDFVPEYLGSALTFVRLNSAPAPSRPGPAHELLVKAFQRRGVRVLQFAPAENKNEIVVRRATASQHGLRTISELRPLAPKLVFGGPPECPARPLCLEGLAKTYGLHFKSFQPLDTGGPLTVAALEGKEVDVGLLFSTDPTIAERKLVVLRDDRHLQPPENVVPVVRQRVVRIYGQALVTIVDQISSRLSTNELRELNARVARGRPIREVAAAWLRKSAEPLAALPSSRKQLERQARWRT